MEFEQDQDENLGPQVVMKIGGKELRVKKGKGAGRGGSLNLKMKNSSSKNQCYGWGDDGEGGLAGRGGGGGQGNYDSSQDHEQVQDSGRDPGDGGGDGAVQRPIEKKGTEENRPQARRQFDDRVRALTRGKIVQRPVVKKLWVAGRVSEDRRMVGGG